MERYANRAGSYFVTELLGTDLHRLLTSRPLERQFIQYFLYQIMVGLPIPPVGIRLFPTTYDGVVGGWELGVANRLAIYQQEPMLIWRANSGA